MGDGDAPRRAPALDSRVRGNDDFRVWGGGGCFGEGEGPAAAGHGGTGNRPYDGELGIRRGCGWGCPAPRPSGYRRSPVRRWGVWGGGGCWWGGPSSSVGGFDRLRANGGLCGVAETPGRTMGGCGVWRIWEDSVKRVRWGVGDAMGDGDAPRRAPALDSRVRGNDDGGVRGRGAVGGWGVRVPLRRDGRFANRPYDGEWGMRRGFGWGCAAPAPLWIPAFAGTTMGVCAGIRRGVLVVGG